MTYEYNQNIIQFVMFLKMPNIDSQRLRNRIKGLKYTSNKNVKFLLLFLILKSNALS